jgi:hypothetical protein
MMLASVTAKHPTNDRSDARYARRLSSARLPNMPRGRAAVCVAVLTLALAAAGAPATLAAGFEGSGALSELTQSQGQATQTQTTTTSNSGTTEPSNSKGLILAALGAAVVLLSGIAYVIVRDARRVAPAGDEDLLERRSARDQAVTMAKRRAKAKAARHQRKRNR